MNVYPIALFFHVSGAIGVFVGIGTLLLGTAALRRAKRVEQVRTIAGPMVAGRMVKSEPVSVIDLLVISGVLLIAATGLYMALTVWGLRSGWIDMALVSFALMAPIGPVVINPRLHAIASAADKAPDGPLPESLYVRTHDPVLGTALQTLAAWLLGIVFLMTNKPSFAGSITVMAVSLAVGLASGVPFWRVARIRARG